MQEIFAAIFKIDSGIFHDKAIIRHNTHVWENGKNCEWAMTGS